MYSLFIDESGKPDLRSVDPSSPHFSLSGVIVHSNAQESLKIKADQIKYKYWGHTNVVFHAYDLRQQAGDFNIFRAHGAKFTVGEFYSDFSSLLRNNYKVGLVSINKDSYLSAHPNVAHSVTQLQIAGPKSNWERTVTGTSNNLLKKAATEIIAMYLHYLNRKDGRGQVIIESSDEVQDMLLFAAYNKIMISGYAPFGMNTTAVRNRLTGISFVTKRNHDIESQLADIAAHYLNLELKIADELIAAYPRPHDEDVVDILKSKAFQYQKASISTPESSLYSMF